MLRTRFSAGLPRVRRWFPHVGIPIHAATAAVVLAAAIPAATAAQETAEAARRGWTPEEQVNVRPVGNVVASPDGQRVVFTVSEPVMDDERSEFVTQVWVAAADGSESVQFTHGEKSSTSPSWSPDGAWIAFTSTRSGKSNLWRIHARGGEAEQITDVKSGVGAFAWSPDGRSIAFLMEDPPSDDEEKAEKRRDDARVVDDDFRMTHLWVVSVEKDAEAEREPRRLTDGAFTVGGGFSGGFDWSPDGRRIAFPHQPTPRVDDWPLADVSVVDVQTGEIRGLASTNAAESQPLFSPDGRWIAYTASDDPASWAFMRHVHVMPAEGGEPRRLAATFDEQPSLVGWSTDSRAIYFTETHGTATRLSALPIDGGEPVTVGEGSPAVFSASLNHSRTAFGLSGQSADEAPEAYATRVEQWSPARASRANAELPPHAVPITEVVQWTAPDGLEIEGLVTYPVGYEAGQRVPMLVIAHGGPTGVMTRTFVGNRGVYPVAAFAAEGFAVFRPNFRGSSGYGREFRYANYGDWGVGDYQDIMSGVDHLIERGVADPDRLGFMGWSYGGYMTSRVITQTDRFRAASVGAAVTNLMSFTGTADIPGFIPDYFNGEFWDDPEPYARHSAMFNVKGVTTPTLIQHGERDLRVPLSQGQELYNALVRQGVTVRMVVYPRQPHGLQEPRHIIDAGRRNLDWFRTHVLERAAAEDSVEG